MFGISVAIALTIGSAAGVLTVLARKHAPEDGWRQVLRDGVDAAKHKQLHLLEDYRANGGARGGAAGLGELFTLAGGDDRPAYTDASELRAALARARALTRR